MKSIGVPSRRWYENAERELMFPDRWELANLTSPGMDKPDLSPEQIREKLKPLSTDRLFLNWQRTKGRPLLCSTT